MAILKDKVLKSEKVAWRTLKWLQAETLKDPISIDKLVASLVENGLIRGFHVWQDPEGELWILDGHHMKLALETIEKGNLLEIPEELTCYFIECDNRKEAGKIVLLHSATYAKISATGVMDHLASFDLNLDELSGMMELEAFDFGKSEKIALAALAKEAAEETEFKLNVPVQAVSVLGDLYELNEHRVQCASSTEMDAADRLFAGRVSKLIVTDPPYNVDYTGKTKDALKIENDKMSKEGFYQFLYDFYIIAYANAAEGCPAYIFHADSEGANFRQALVDAGFKLSQCLIWLKQSMVMGRQDYHWKHEPILYGWREGAAHPWYSDRKQTTVLEFNRPTRNAEHPTMKPLDILEYLIGNSSEIGDIVADYFLGSGSTLMACERTGRVCYGNELGPNYCDVIVRRWVNYMKENSRPYTVKRNGVELTDAEVAEILSNVDGTLQE